jgi:23S rRNA A2030 N6-methylase RlmJ
MNSKIYYEYGTISTKEIENSYINSICISNDNEWIVYGTSASVCIYNIENEDMEKLKEYDSENIYRVCINDKCNIIVSGYINKIDIIYRE